ncbi:MAG TPA: hypothetical protein PK530_25420 [Anaerolineales bacterium]|nr:hypothetical protein [Anaerolineales bacterium]
MNLSFYVERGSDYFVAWRSIEAPKDECGRGSTPEEAIIALLLTHPAQTEPALTEAKNTFTNHPKQKAGALLPDSSN